ncbi:MAG: GGDEF domain-containing protein [Gemmatimonadota bacterium]|nr:GGDEF domain-containing protein [Gemmatimonadota bacterium]
MPTELGLHPPTEDSTDVAFLRSVLDHVRDGVYFVDRHRRITYWNNGAEQISGYTSAEVLGHCCADNLLNHVDHAGCQLCVKGCPLTAAISTGTIQESQVFLRHREGHRVPVQVRVMAVRDQDGSIVGAVESFSDRTQSVRTERHLAELQRTALTDPLTGLGNRRYLEAKAANCLSELDAGISCGALFFDIDHFKQVNDTCGHAVGDAVLQMLGRTLASNLREEDAVARVGGEEFIILLQAIDRAALAQKAETLRALVANSRLLREEGDLQVTVSVGATMGHQGEAVQDWLARADTGLYQSKREGRNRVTVIE